MLFRTLHRTRGLRSRCRHCNSLRQAPAILAVALFVIPGCALGQSQPDQQQNKIHGTVVNSVTQAPVPRALVYSADNRYAILTDGEGQFEFTLANEKPGNETPQSGTIFGTVLPSALARQGNRILLRARKPGFLDDSAQHVGTWASSGSESTISLTPEALIKGRVSLSTSDAATGIDIQLFSRLVQDGLPRWFPRMSARTNSTGEFRFAGLDPGAYKVVTHEWMDNDPVTAVPGGPVFAFPPVYYPGAPDFVAAQTIQITAGQTVEADLSLTRQPYYAVRIPVAGPDVVGMNVRVEGARGPGYSLGYNPPEHRIEGLLPTGTYNVRAATYGAEPSTGTVRLAVAGAPTEGPAMVLVRNSSIRLDVKEEFSNANYGDSGSWSDGKHTFALHGARLHLQVQVQSADDLENFNGGGVRPPTGPNDDSMVLENMPPGRYWLRLHTGRGYVASASQGGVDLLHEPLVVGAGAGDPIEIKLRDDGAEIEGTVSTLAARSAEPDSAAMGERTPQAWVYCIPQVDGAGTFQQFAVFGDGKFRSTEMAPGSYRIVAFATEQPNLAYRDPEAMRSFEMKGQVIHLTAGQKTSVQVPILSSE